VSARRGLSKRTRFEVFKRDGFTCIYCGGVPPTSVLEIDHIEPVAEGGGNEETNLVTSCYDCNRGKAAVPLTKVPEGLLERAVRLGEAEEQLRAYREIMRAVEDRKDADAWNVVIALTGKAETTVDRMRSIRRFLDKLPYEDVLEAAQIAAQNMPRGNAARFRYFCGVCWNRVRANEA
jgi:hypothetical protein